MVKFRMPKPENYVFDDDVNKLEISIEFLTRIDYRINCPACGERHFLTQTYGGLFCQNALKSLEGIIEKSVLNARIRDYGLGEALDNEWEE